MKLPSNLSLHTRCLSSPRIKLLTFFLPSKVSSEASQSTSHLYFFHPLLRFTETIICHGLLYATRPLIHGSAGYIFLTTRSLTKWRLLIIYHVHRQRACGYDWGSFSFTPIGEVLMLSIYGTLVPSNYSNHHMGHSPSLGCYFVLVASQTEYPTQDQS